jgi:hypothetical protein
VTEKSIFSKLTKIGRKIAGISARHYLSPDSRCRIKISSASPILVNMGT